MRHVDRRDRMIRALALEFILCSQSIHRVEVGERFVEKEDARRKGERPAERDLLALPRGELPRTSRKEPVTDADSRCDPLNDVSQRFTGETAQIEGEPEIRDAAIVVDAQVREERAVLEDHPNPPLARPQSIDDLTVEPSLAGARSFEPGDQLEKGRLPTSGRADDGEERSRIDHD